METVKNYLNNIDIYHVSPCFAESGKIRVKARLSDDVSEIMPYLNRVVKNASYNAHAPNLTMFREFRMITLEPAKLILIKALNDTDARQVLDWLKELINHTAIHKAEIEPLHESKQRPHPLELFTFLPRINCGQCGETTCLAFAALLFAGLQSLENCKPLFTDDYKEHHKAMINLANLSGHDVS